LKRWSQLTTVKASLSITGTLWQLKGQADALKDVVVEAQLKCQQLTTHLIGKNRRTVFAPDRVSIKLEAGIVEEGRVVVPTKRRVTDALRVLGRCVYS
jgi:hypothetical protein